MAEEIKPEVKPEAGAGEQVVDYEALYKEQSERLRTAEEAARNLRKGYDKYKAIAKAKEDDEEPDAVEVARQIVQEELAKSTVSQERQKLEDLNLKMARELKEARLAVASKQTVASTGMGSGQGGLEVKTDYFSQEQVESLKKRGFSPEMIKNAENKMRANPSTFPLPNTAAR